MIVSSSQLRVFLSSAAIIAGLLFAPSVASAQEVCGDGIDNDSDGIADNGCYPAGVTGVCESPLSCAQTGAVAPLTGQLVYHETTDIAPRVPYGPSIALRRVYMSQYNPGYLDPADTDFRAPFGYGWQHNFMSWADIGTSDIVVHTTGGQDVRFTQTSQEGDYDIYSPQPGYHFEYLRTLTSGGPNEWELKTLSGRVFTC